MRAWLVKQEPETSPWSQLVSEKKTLWDGGRNDQTRNFIRQMVKGDLVLFYHGGKAKEFKRLLDLAQTSL